MVPVLKPIVEFLFIYLKLHNVYFYSHYETKKKKTKWGPFTTNLLGIIDFVVHPQMSFINNDIKKNWIIIIRYPWWKLESIIIKLLKTRQIVCWWQRVRRKKAASIVEEKIHDNISILHISGFVPVSNITVSIQGELLSTAQQAVITNATNVCFYSGCIPGSDI